MYDNACRYAPWWMDVEVLRPDSHTRQRLNEAAGLPAAAPNGNSQPPMPREVYESLPDDLRPMVRHRL